MKNSLYNQKYFYTQDEIDYLKNIIKGRTTKEIIELYNKKYDKNMTYNQLILFQKKYKVRSGLDTTFKKGKVDNPNPPQHIGYEFVSYQKNGIKRTRIKIGKNKWIDKQRYIYEQYYGKIPKDCVIIFLDGNRDNFDINNLKCITKEQHRIIAGNCLYFNNKYLNEISIDNAKLIIKTKDKRKECQNETNNR